MGIGTTRTKSHDKESRRAWLATLMAEAMNAFAGRMMAGESKTNPNVIRDIRDTMLAGKPLAGGQTLGSRNSGVQSRSRNTGAAAAKRAAVKRANVRKHPRCQGV